MVFGSIAAVPFVSANASASAQNRISGFVFGINRQPMGDLYVELVDEDYQTVERTKTNGGGRYYFTGMSAGRYTIRVNAITSLYEDGEVATEIQNVTHTDDNGVVRTSGYDNQSIDVYLKLRKGITALTAAVFVQAVPPEAKKRYDAGIGDFENKKNTEGLAELKAALEIFPTYFDALERLGNEYVKLGRPETYQAAAILLKNAVDVNSRAFRSWYGLAYARYKLGAIAEAVPAAQKAVELNGGWPDAVFLYGVLLKSTKKYDEAEKQLLKAEELAKDSNPRIHWELATLYGRILNRYAEAAKELKLFLKAQPESKDAENIKKLIADFEAKAAAK
jgi:tetratricopeptide (TPR) repeat protein